MDEACTRFRNIFKEKCGHDFNGRSISSLKQPGKFLHLDVDFDIANQMQKTFVQSKLSPPIYNLMKMIFDMKHIKTDKMVMTCELDLKRWPLGKISSQQIYKATNVLKRIAKCIKEHAKLAELRNASNEFYTLIPHGFSIDRPPIIYCIDMVKQKNEFLEKLLNMDMIYGFLENENENGQKINPFDVCHKMITTDINVLSKDASEFIKISEIVRNTHGATHNAYTLEVLDVFKLKRKREDVRSKKYQKLENHQMLWHGSRSTNFVSILTKGLRIAPKDAPSTGKYHSFHLFIYQNVC